MRLNLGCGNDIRSGYVNVDLLPAGQNAPHNYKQGDMRTLDWLTENDTVEEIVALDCLEYVENNVTDDMLVNWVTKLQKNGTLKILIPDCYSVAKAFAQGQLNINEYSQIIFGTNISTDKRVSVLDSQTLINVLQKLGLTIKLKRYDGIAFYVEACK